MKIFAPAKNKIKSWSSCVWEKRAQENFKPPNKVGCHCLLEHWMSHSKVSSNPLHTYTYFPLHYTSDLHQKWNRDWYMRAKNKSNEIWRTENSEIQIIGVGSGMKKRLENLKTLTWSLESPRQFSHFDVASVTKHKIYYEEEREEEDSPPKPGPCRRESIKWRKRREETKRAAKRMMWSMSCLILLPRNGRRIQCLKALDLMLGTDSSSSMWSVSLVWFFLVEEKEELDAWKLERKLGFTVLTNFFLGFNAQFLIFPPQRRKEESVSIGLKRKNQELSIESNLFTWNRLGTHPPDSPKISTHDGG